VIGIGMIELLALSMWPCGRCKRRSCRGHRNQSCLQLPRRGRKMVIPLGQFVEQQAAIAGRNGRGPVWLFGWRWWFWSCSQPARPARESLTPEAARRFVSGKLFAFNCFDGSRGAIYVDGSVIGTIQFRGAGPARTVSVPAETLRVRGEAVCASLQGRRSSRVSTSKRPPSAAFAARGWALPIATSRSAWASPAWARAGIRQSRYRSRRQRSRRDVAQLDLHDSGTPLDELKLAARAIRFRYDQRPEAHYLDPRVGWGDEVRTGA